MNYIKRLEQQADVLADRILNTQREISELRSYLYSDKFYAPNDFVYVQDALNRLNNVSRALDGV